MGFSVIAKDVTKQKCRLNIYPTSRRAGLSASAELLVFQEHTKSDNRLGDRFRLATGMHPNSATNTKTSTNTVPALDFLSFRLKLNSIPGYVKVGDTYTSAKFYSTASTLSSGVSTRKHAQRAAVLPTLSVRLSVTRGGFNGRPLVQWPTRPLGCWALEAPGLGAPEG